MTENSKPPEPIYTDNEVGDIMWLQGAIYALDDAIENQTQIHRPETFIAPIKQIRELYAQRLVAVTSKGKPTPEAKKEE